MITTSALLLAYIGIGLLSILVIALSRSEKSLSIASITQSLFYLLLSIYIAAYEKMPIFFTKNSFFFIDTFALYEVTIASFIFFLATIYLRGYLLHMIDAEEIDKKYTKVFHAGFNFLLLSVILAFFSNNIALFWIFLELTTLFSVLLITLLKSKDNIVAGLHYIFIVSPAMIFSFIGIIILYVATKVSGNASLNWFDIMNSMHSSGAPDAKLVELAFIFIFIGFAAKSGVVPFHSWLPKAHSKAPSPVSALLSAIITTVSIYGIIRVLAVVAQTEFLNKISMLLIAFGLLSLIIASLTMLQEKNVKTILAFSTIEQIGIILIGLGIATKVSIFWTIIYMTFHTLIKALLFFSAGIFNMQYQSNDLESIFNLIKLQPLASFGIIIGSLAIIGLPPLILFAPKLYLLMELGKYSLIILGIVLFFILIAISAFTIFMTKIVSYIKNEQDSAGIKRLKLPREMRFTLILLIIMIIILGFYIPETFKEIIRSIVAQLGF